MNDSEKFGTIVNAVMTADWKYDVERVSEYEGNASLYGYRKQRVCWAIKKMNTMHSKAINLEELSINEMPEPEQENVSRNLEDVEYLEFKLNKSQLLSEKEKTYIRLLFVENKSLEDLVDMFKIDKRTLRYKLRNGLIKLGIHNEYIRRFFKSKESRRKNKRRD